MKKYHVFIGSYYIFKNLNGHKQLGKDPQYFYYENNTHKDMGEHTCCETLPTKIQ